MKIVFMSKTKYVICEENTFFTTRLIFFNNSLVQIQSSLINIIFKTENIPYKGFFKAYLILSVTI